MKFTVIVVSFLLLWIEAQSADLHSAKLQKVNPKLEESTPDYWTTREPETTTSPYWWDTTPDWWQTTTGWWDTRPSGGQMDRQHGIIQLKDRQLIIRQQEQAGGQRKTQQHQTGGIRLLHIGQLPLILLHQIVPSVGWTLRSAVSSLTTALAS